MTLTLPQYFVDHIIPVKLVETDDGGMVALKMNLRTGDFEPDLDAIEKVLFGRGGDVHRLSEEEFIQAVEYARGRYLINNVPGELRALYETINAVEEPAIQAGRALTAEEQALVTSLRRRTHAMFEEYLHSRSQ